MEEICKVLHWVYSTDNNTPTRCLVYIYIYIMVYILHTFQIIRLEALRFPLLRLLFFKPNLILSSLYLDAYK